MSNVVIAGLQWGDEGKGKIVDLVCPAFDAVARFQGGHNAGHTVKFGDRHFALRLIPSGILHDGMRCVMGNGMVIAPQAFTTELGELIAAGVDPTGPLFISDRATALLPPHVHLDRAREAGRGADAIGTTSRGIGPAYESKAGRYGLRVADLSAPDLEERLEGLLAVVRPQLAALGADGNAAGGDDLDPSDLEVGPLAERCRAWAADLAPYVADAGSLLRGWLRDGASVLFEGAQGALLDIDHGTFPFVTSSSSTVGGAPVGAGVPPTAIDGVLGILKAYTTRVGAGPFTTELTDDVGRHLGKRGNEFGTVTGRPRRCGWLDLVAGRYAARVNGLTGIALTKLDVMDELAEVKVCVGYRIGGEVRRDYPGSRAELTAAEPVYETMPGWQTQTMGLLDYADLPQAAKDYIAFVEEEMEAPAVIVSTGPRREETILRREVAAFDGLLGEL
ncbi:MAG TPA: adenylosuccinate synthase [Thermoanaerobaculia bacterium]|nr:adenylosuccinate synthase [Thermoanaerobaculia bacterium]